MDRDWGLAELDAINANWDQKAGHRSLDGPSHGPLVFDTLLADGDGRDHGDEAKRLIPNRRLDLVPEVVTSFESNQVVPDLVSSQLQL